MQYQTHNLIRTPISKTSRRGLPIGSEHATLTPNPTPKPAKSNTQQARIPAGVPSWLEPGAGPRFGIRLPCARSEGIRSPDVGGSGQRRGDKTYARAEQKRRRAAQPQFIPGVPAVRCPASSGYQLRFGDWELRISIEFGGFGWVSCPEAYRTVRAISRFASVGWWCDWTRWF